MSARNTESKSGEAEIIEMPLAEKPAPAMEAPRPEAAPAPKKRNGRRIAIMVSVPVILAAIGGYFYLTGGRYQDTDNAYVQQAKVAISADVAGRITSVSVRDNQVVKAGDALFTLDPEPYRIALAQADAALATARVNVEQLKVAYGTAQAQLTAAQSTLALRQSAFDRKNALVQGGNASDATLDDVKLALEGAQNAVIAAQQQVASTVAALTGNPELATDQHPAVEAALASRDAAARNLSKATVIAPADGIVSQVSSLNVGQFIATGTTIASLVETGDTWIEANFKETQLSSISIGMPVDVSVDAYPGVKFEGHLDSIAAATGAQFALIPAQNATGNWVKVTQRIPVRISVTPIDGKTLRAGMSAVVAVDTKPAG